MLNLPPAAAAADVAILSSQYLALVLYQMSPTAVDVAATATVGPRSQCRPCPR